MAAAYKDIINGAEDLDFEGKVAALTAYVNGEKSFKAGDTEYALNEEGMILKDGETVGYISRFLVPQIILPRSVKSSKKHFRPPSTTKRRVLPWQMLMVKKQSISWSTNRLQKAGLSLSLL